MHVDVSRFAGADITDERETQHIQRTALRGDHIFRSNGRAALSQDSRTDAMGITKPHQTVAVDHGNYRITAPAPADERCAPT